MARMYPREVSPGNPSAAEKRIFVWLRDGLGDEWVVLHSLGLVGHPSKPWAEIDFVLIGPPGVFCLEVKGGRLERIDGVWTFTNRFGKETRKTHGPFEQVGSAAGALTHYLSKRLPWAWETPVGYGVVVPDIEFSITAPDVESNVVYDRRDAAKPISRYVERLAEYWISRITRQHGKPTRTLTGADVKAVLHELRPDFDLRPSLRMRLGLISEELLRLTEAQYQILDGLQDNPTAVIRGGAGTGKTFLAVEEARRAADLGKRVLLCCFNRALASELGVTVSDRHLITACHLHGFMAAKIAEAQLQDQIPAADESDVFTLFQPLVTLDALPRVGLEGAFDLLVVDEAQDLLHDAYLDVFDRLLKDGLAGGYWRFFYDPRQNIFEGIDPKGMRRLLNLHPAQYRLTTNCRNTEPIAVAVGLLSGTRCDETLLVQGPKVETRWYADGRDQRRQVSRYVGRLVAQGLSPDQIVILSPRRLSNSCLSQGFIRLPYTVTDAMDDAPRPGSMRFRTIQSFKGLESDVVVLIEIDCLTGTAASALYVGASRARAQLAVFIAETARIEYAERAAEFGRILAGV